MENALDDRIQLVGDLRLAAALAGAPAGLADDDLEHAGSARQSSGRMLRIPATESRMKSRIAAAGVLGDLGLARHITYGNVLIPALSEQASGSVSDESPGARLLALAQAGASSRLARQVKHRRRLRGLADLFAAVVSQVGLHDDERPAHVQRPAGGVHSIGTHGTEEVCF